MSDDFYDDDARYEDEDDGVDDDDESVGSYRRSASNPLYSSGLPARNRASRTGVRPYSSSGNSSGDDEDDEDSQDVRGSLFGTSSNTRASYQDRYSKGRESDGGSRSPSYSSGNYSRGSSSRTSGTYSSSRDPRERDSGGSSSGTRSSSSSYASRYSRERDGGDGGSGSASKPDRPVEPKKDDAPKPDSKKDNAKKDDSGGGVMGRFSGGMSALRSKIPGGGSSDSGDKGGKKDDAKKDSGGGNNIANRISSGVGNLRSKIPGSGDSGDKGAKKNDAKKDDSGGGVMGRFSGGMSALRSRMPGGGSSDSGDKGAKKDNTSGGDKPAQPKGNTRGGVGSNFRNRERYSADSNAGASTAAAPPKEGGGRSFGRFKPGGGKADSAPAQAKAETKKDSGGGLFSKVAGSIPFVGGGGDDKPARTSKTRKAQSKIPKTKEDSGLSLDDKLDILGVALVVSAFVLFISSLSPQQGAITGAINNLITQIFGWGAIAVPAALMAIGLWLIVRHFGEDAPEIDPVRVSGLVMLYIGALMVFQFIETFNEIYQYASPETLYLFVQESIEQGRGGGMIGAELYYLVITNIGEVAGFMLIIGWMMIGIMLTTRTTAGELAIFVISIWRSFQVAQQQRAQRRQLERLTAQEEQAQISVSKPATAELSSGTAGALPAGSSDENTDGYVPIEERGIPIRMGGQTINASQPVPVQQAQSSQQQPAASMGSGGSEDDSSSSGLFGGIASRVMGAVPALPSIGSSSDDENTNGTKTDDDSSGLLGGLFNRRTSVSGTATNSDSSNGRTEPTPTQHTPPAASVAPAQPATTSSSAQVAPSPYARPVDESSSATTDDDSYTEDSDLLTNLPPAKPKGVMRRTQSPGGIAARLRDAQSEQDKADAEKQATEQPTAETSDAQSEQPGGSLTERMSRMNAIRSGKIAPDRPTPSKIDDSDDEDDESVNVARPSADEIFGKRPASTPSSGIGSRVRPFPGGDNQRDEKQTEQPAATAKPAESPKPTQQPAAEQKPAESQPAASKPVINMPQAPQPAQQPPTTRRQWRLPDYRTLLASGSEQEFDRDSLVTRARTIEETLSGFGAPGRVVEINTGPVITQFGVEPDYLTARGGKKSRVKVSAIAQLDKDLQLALGAKSIRVEAPVPGKGYVGVEVPNEEASLVSLRDVMEARQFNKIADKSPLAIALGQSVDGAPVSADLSQMPHLLIAGTTGSGKSVCVNSVIASILIRNTPEQVKFIMVDPKRVELTGYNGIPHLVAPVVVELERIVGVLKWVTREMDERYKKFSDNGSRNIVDYNKHLKPGMEPMPYIVVIIDELADLMMLAPDETERVITRIAALARATGIHLVIATQRPSVDVVTGLIKANFPSRIAFAVASGTDSRVILDQPGAERLLGRGDMLYMSGDSPAPLRLQGVYVSDMEINNITRYWRTQMPADAPQKPITALVMDDSPKSRSVNQRSERFVAPPSSTTQRAFWDSNNDDDDLTEGEVDAQNQEDELYGDAVELVRRLNKASVSLLQRRLRIGYTRAARMIDMMETQGIIGPPTEGSKPREVLKK